MEHPFWVVGYGFKPAEDLKAGDYVETADGEQLLVTNVEKETLAEPVPVYNFEVEDWHTYYVSEEEVLVHNNGCMETAGSETSEQWYRSTFDTVEDSMKYHLYRHGKGRSIEEYTQDAMNFYNQNKHLGKKVILKDGTEGIKIQTGTGKNKVGGYWTKDGKLVTFWD